MRPTMKLLTVFAALGLALVASPVVGTASAYVCDWNDVDCQERWVRECVVGPWLGPLPPQPCPP